MKGDFTMGVFWYSDDSQIGAEMYCGHTSFINVDGFVRAHITEEFTLDLVF